MFLGLLDLDPLVRGTDPGSGFASKCHRSPTLVERTVRRGTAAAESRIERNGTERNGTERNGTERNGTERNGTERNGTEGKARQGKARQGKARVLTVEVHHMGALERHTQRIMCLYCNAK
jgi:hypothetical protein